MGERPSSDVQWVDFRPNHCRQKAASHPRLWKVCSTLLPRTSPKCPSCCGRGWSCLESDAPAAQGGRESGVASCWLGTPSSYQQSVGNPPATPDASRFGDCLYQPEHAAEDEQLKAVVDLCELSAQPEAFDLLNSQGKIREIPTETSG